MRSVATWSAEEESAQASAGEKTQPKPPAAIADPPLTDAPLRTFRVRLRTFRRIPVIVYGGALVSLHISLQKKHGQKMFLDDFPNLNAGTLV